MTRSPTLIALVFLLLSGISSTSLALDASSEDEITSAFLFNFARYTQWPPTKNVAQDAPVWFCFYHAEQTARVFTAVLTDTTLDGRHIRVKSVETPANLSGCDLVYTQDPSPGWLATPVYACLTIGRGDKFIANGGVISLVHQRGHLRFKINRGAAAKSGLTLSSKLLSLAVEVIDD